MMNTSPPEQLGTIISRAAPVLTLAPPPHPAPAAAAASSAGPATGPAPSSPAAALVVDGTSDAADDLAHIAISAYERLVPPKQRPDHEWTVYCAILARFKEKKKKKQKQQQQQQSEEQELLTDTEAHMASLSHPILVAFATGTKCLGRALAATDKQGARLLDSHAEVLTRRSLVRLLLNQLKRELYIGPGSKLKSHAEADQGFIQGQHDFVLLQQCGGGGGGTTTTTHENAGTNGLFKLRSDIELVMYISQAPCGDAAIWGRKRPPPVRSLGSEPDTSVRSEKRQRIAPGSSGVTGAKSVTSAPLDPESKESWVQQTGVLRTKSGRSDLAAHQRTESMCCSDKIARWCITGLQGSLLARFLSKPIYLSSIVVSRAPTLVPDGQARQFSALRRALTERISCLASRLEVPLPDLGISSVPFPCAPSASRKSPSGLSLNYAHIIGLNGTDKVEVTVGKSGLKQGVSKKLVAMASLKTRSRLCSSQLFKLYGQALLVHFPHQDGIDALDWKEYNAHKSLSQMHQQLRKAALTEARAPFQGWLTTSRAASELESNMAGIEKQS